MSRTPWPWWYPELRPCGTDAAYRRHLRRGERPCLACRRANARVQQDRAQAGYVRPSRRQVAS